MGLVVSILVGLVGFIAACSGSSATIGGGGLPGDAAPSSDGAPGSDASSNGDTFVPIDANGEDARPDAGFVVNEKPAPDCNDLTQHGALVTPVGDPGNAPAQVPIATVAPGLYVLVSATDYGDVTPIPPALPSRTTVVFTATRQYYRSEDGNGDAPQVLTLDWKIANNRITRKVLCAAQPAQVGTTVDYRIDGSPKGFIVYVPSSGGGGPVRLQAFRYDRVD